MEYFTEHDGSRVTQVAHHEAGHAIAALELGWLIQRIEMKPGPAGRYSGTVHSLGWMVPSTRGLMQEWFEPCWKGTPDQKRLVLADLQVLAAGWVAENMFLAKSSGRGGGLGARARMQPTISALKDLAQMDARAQLLVGDYDGQVEVIATMIDAVAATLEPLWKTKLVPLAKLIASSAKAAPVGEIATIDGGLVHRSFGYPSPEPSSLDHCPHWQPDR